MTAPAKTVVSPAKKDSTPATAPAADSAPKKERAAKRPTVFFCAVPDVGILVFEDTDNAPAPQWVVTMQQNATVLAKYPNDKWIRRDVSVPSIPKIG